MIHLSFIVDNVNTVLQIYNTIQVQRASQELPADETNYSTLSGVDGHPIPLVAGTVQYALTDPAGISSSWYRSRYYSTSTGSVSAWSDPILGEPGDLYYNPLFPPEIAYGTADQLVIDRIRRLIGDPIGLRREYGSEAASSIHFDDKTYELDERGWPVSVTMGGIAMNDSTDPTINGYRFLKFDQDITIISTVSGVEYGIDIWYYTFRFSDREIMEAYDNCPVPIGLTLTTVTPEAFILQTSIDLLTQNATENVFENGAKISDEGSHYDPATGIEALDDLLDKLQKRLDDLVKRLMMSGITGYRLD